MPQTGTLPYTQNTKIHCTHKHPLLINFIDLHRAVRQQGDQRQRQFDPFQVKDNWYHAHQ
jgi:hypothetical protein